MPNISRIGDQATGICSNHIHPQSVTGVISSTTNGILVDRNGIFVAVVGDIVTFSCGHTSFIVTGLNKSSLRGKPLAMVGSVVSGNNIVGQIITGSDIIQGN